MSNPLAIMMGQAYRTQVGGVCVNCGGTSSTSYGCPDLLPEVLDVEEARFEVTLDLTLGLFFWNERKGRDRRRKTRLGRKNMQNLKIPNREPKQVCLVAALSTNKDSDRCCRRWHISLIM
jgi:hypothetical protein